MTEVLAVEVHLLKTSATAVTNSATGPRIVQNKIEELDIASTNDVLSVMSGVTKHEIVQKVEAVLALHTLDAATIPMTQGIDAEEETEITAETANEVVKDDTIIEDLQAAKVLAAEMREATLQAVKSKDVIERTQERHQGLDLGLDQDPETEATIVPKAAVLTAQETVTQGVWNVTKKSQTVEGVRTDLAHQQVLRHPLKALLK